MAFLDVALAVLIILMLVIIIWSKIENQRILDTIIEMKEIIATFGGNAVDKVKK